MEWPSARNCWIFWFAPLCKEPVTLTPDGKGLKCGKCRRVYPIQDDIPVMLVDEAIIDPE